MLTVRDLDAFLDELVDLTRDADPVELVVEATTLIGDNRTQRYLMERRAAAAADAHYLDGISLPKIAAAAGQTRQSTRNWIDSYGPKHYLLITREDPRPGEKDYRYTLRLSAINLDDHAMKRRFNALRRNGARIVPARYDLVDPESPDGIRPLNRWPATPEQLWEQLG